MRKTLAIAFLLVLSTATVSAKGKLVLVKWKGAADDEVTSMTIVSGGTSAYAYDQKGNQWVLDGKNAKPIKFQFEGKDAKPAKFCVAGGNTYSWVGDGDGQCICLVKADKLERVMLEDGKQLPSSWDATVYPHEDKLYFDFNRGGMADVDHLYYVIEGAKAKPLEKPAGVGKWTTLQFCDAGIFASEFVSHEDREVLRIWKLIEGNYIEIAKPEDGIGRAMSPAFVQQGANLWMFDSTASSALVRYDGETWHEERTMRNGAITAYASSAGIAFTYGSRDSLGLYRYDGKTMAKVNFGVDNFHARSAVLAGDWLHVIEGNSNKWFCLNLATGKTSEVEHSAQKIHHFQPLMSGKTTAVFVYDRERAGKARLFLLDGASATQAEPHGTWTERWGVCQGGFYGFLFEDDREKSGFYFLARD